MNIKKLLQQKHKNNLYCCEASYFISHSINKHRKAWRQLCSQLIAKCWYHKTHAGNSTLLDLLLSKERLRKINSKIAHSNLLAFSNYIINHNDNLQVYKKKSLWSLCHKNGFKKKKLGIHPTNLVLILICQARHYRIVDWLNKWLKIKAHSLTHTINKY